MLLFHGFEVPHAVRLLTWHIVISLWRPASLALALALFVTITAVLDPCP